MFSAMPVETHKRLEFFRLVLILRDKGIVEIPVRLSEDFESILHQARSILSDPSLLSPDTHPQAVQLAIEFQGDPTLVEVLNGVQSVTDISPEIASSALRSLEPKIASANGP